MNWIETSMFKARGATTQIQTQMSDKVNTPGDSPMCVCVFSCLFKVLAAVRICSSSCVPCMLPSAPSTSSTSPSNPARRCANAPSTAVSPWWSATTTAGLTAFPAASYRCTTAESASHLRPSSRQRDQVLLLLLVMLFSLSLHYMCDCYVHSKAVDNW